MTPGGGGRYVARARAAAAGLVKKDGIAVSGSRADARRPALPPDAILTTVSLCTKLIARRRPAAGHRRQLDAAGVDSAVARGPRTAPRQRRDQGIEIPISSRVPNKKKPWRSRLLRRRSARAGGRKS